MSPYVGLLRGVNVGGKNKLPMRDLVALVEAARGADARTFIQSGNVVFRAEPGDVERVRAAIVAGIAARFGFAPPLVLLDGASFAGALVDPPFPEAPEDQRHVYFLADTPAPDRVARLDPARSPGDRFAVRGREVHLWLANGVADTKLTNSWLDRGLATVSTGRNWRTIRAIVAMLG